MADRTPLRLEDLPDVLTINELCRVLRISLATYYRYPDVIPSLPGLPRRFAKADVEAYLRGDAKARRGLRTR